MACPDHPNYQGLRTPRSDCPGCWKVYNEKKGITLEAIEKAREVIKSKVKLEKEDTLDEKPVEVVVKEVMPDQKILEVMKDPLVILREEIDKIVEKAIKSFEFKARELSNIKFEHLDVPLVHFNSALLSKLEKEGWGYKDMFRGDVAKVSGYKCDTVLLIRVKNSDLPPRPNFKEK